MRPRSATRVVAYDGVAAFYGYSNPPATYHPRYDPTLALSERMQKFHEWVAAYHTHGDPIEANTMTLRHGPSAAGSDSFISQMCMKHGLYKRLKNAAFYLPSGRSAESNDGWDAVELRVLWCDQSVWSVVWAVPCLSEELEEAKRTRRHTRKITPVRVRGASHLAHWDHLKKTMRAFLGNEDEA
ncbi:hypothetical protein C8Q80DRAFT_295992 [Daedaleopsis nitida]|nr:hypothetical protein C8Q80DRAFT_295992 [Daedaleopsis nitida]